MSITQFGKSDVEKHYEDMIKARQIVHEIVTFGVSQEQIMKIIHLLSLELEDNSVMHKISDIVVPKKVDNDETSIVEISTPAPTKSKLIL